MYKCGVEGSKCQFPGCCQFAEMIDDKWIVYCICKVSYYDTCWQVFRCLDAMPLLSLEDPAYLSKVFFRAPLACLGLARWLPFNVGAVAREQANSADTF